MKEVNKKNLRDALAQIQKRADRGEDMCFFSLCKACKLGQSTANKLMYALLDHVYTYPGRDAQKKMYRSRDGKVWKFHFRDPFGRKKDWFMTDDFEDIFAAMQECPKEIANPWYYRENPVVLEPHDPEEDTFRVLGNPKSENPLAKYTTEDLAAELFKRGWMITFGVV